MSRVGLRNDGALLGFADREFYSIRNFFCHSKKNLTPLPSILHPYYRPNLHLRVKILRHLRRQSNTPMRCRAPREDTHMHAYPFPSKAHKPSHRRTLELTAARSTID